ncbi:hypothetical protein VTN77DRAFT_1611 [Rasamsonia byssochlamydoides]|uniref:uncharacterized protein n=1 Tax=Rasamsonia byssochlamydoides TaxID=89139 RepID=UPI0037445395
MASLDDPLRRAADISAELQATIAHSLWGNPPKRLFNGEPSSELELGPYFAYYTDQCNQALHDGGRSTSARVHRDILDIANRLKEPMERDVVRQYVPCNGSDGVSNDLEMRDGSINLAARLLLMMNFGRYRYAISGRKELQWTEGSMRQFLEGHFGTPPTPGNKDVKLEKAFNARNLNRIAGLEIVATSNLADHLRLINDDRAVEIFHHVSFLEYQREESLFPDGFMDETLRTLALLFTQSEKPTRKWFQSLSPSQMTVIDPRLFRCGQLRTDDRQIKNFRFWHDRLVMLKQVYDEARPSNVSQWWYDRRNGVQWYTFWVAFAVLILTIFFGIVQSVEGALQVYKAYHPAS